MCTTCGCGSDNTNISDSHGVIHARVHSKEQHSERTIALEQDILSKNNGYADANRKLFASKNIFVLNLMSSPGSGKTSLLIKTLEKLREFYCCAVIEGDQETSNDADRIRATGVAAIQINTGKGCHLDAHMIGHAVENLDVDNTDVLFIENVGNLVCPAEFDLGEAHKVVMLSVTEGDDKPLKYPNMFAESDIMIINKIDLLPYVDFNLNKCIDYAKRINPKIKVIQTSIKDDNSMVDWFNFINSHVSSEIRVVNF